MASDWIVTKLGDVLEIKYGKDHKKLDAGDIPCFGSGGIMRHVEESLSEQESILIPRKGSLNNIYYVNQPFWTVDTLFWTKIDSDTVFPKFLFYQLKLTDFVSLNVGSAVPSLTVPVLNDLEISLPPLTEQKAIANILGSLDDKIELNREMNETLEAMAQALFKSWFVDFDPVIDNALAAGNSIPDELFERAEQRKTIKQNNSEENQAICSLFPDDFEFTEEMGWIPRGWEVTPAYEVADFINGSSFKSQYFSDENEGLPIVKIAEIKNGISEQTKFTTQEMPEKYLINDGAILFSWSGNPDTSIDTFIWTGGKGWLNQHIFNVVLHKASDKTFVYYLLKYLKPIFTEIARACHQLMEMIVDAK